MGLIGLTCPNCKGNVQIDEDMPHGFCMYCGTRIVNEKMLKPAAGNDRTSEIIGNLEIAKIALTTGNYAKADSLADEVLRIDATVADAWFIKAGIADDRMAKQMCLDKANAWNSTRYNIVCEDDTKTATGFEIKLLFTRVPATRGAQADITVDGQTVCSTVMENETISFFVKPGRHEFCIHYRCRSSFGLGAPKKRMVALNVQDNMHLKTSWSTMTGQLELVPFNE